MFASWWKQSTSLKKLLKLVEPPSKPVNVGSQADWQRVEKEIGTALPSDYKAFIDAYGSGQFGHFYWIYSPFSVSDRTDLLVRIRELCERYQNDHEEDRRRYPFPAYPQQPGLLPWGHDDNGN